MSYYYTYYAGYIKNGKVYPLGPFNSQGDLCPILSRSRSFASSLWEEFLFVKSEQVSDELRKIFEYVDWQDNKRVDVKYLPIASLPTGSFIKKGYYLTKEVEAYEANKDTSEFSQSISPQLYAAKVEKELKFGCNTPKQTEYGEYTEPNASDYMYYMYPDYNCKEYEAHLLREVAEELYDYKISLNDEVKLVILETED